MIEETCMLFSLGVVCARAGGHSFTFCNYSVTLRLTCSLALCSSVTYFGLTILLPLTTEGRDTCCTDTHAPWPFDHGIL